MDALRQNLRTIGVCGRVIHQHHSYFWWWSKDWRGLMREAIIERLFEGYKVEDNNLTIFMLQFIDEALFFEVPFACNILSFKAIMRCFELISSLKVNFHKSKLTNIAISNNSFVRLATIWNCQLMDISFSFLGILIEANARNVGVWNPIVEKLEKRLTGWRNRHLSFGGRICLINPLCLPCLYFFCLFQSTKVDYQEDHLLAT